ncbi:DUF2793 domain-containing protein [Notoacmeibacter sp. MSK16QG-6]|uniref:DUF2793 domain-containing protein n=1 Tax=Notoacmeibacter sp. MSK16QG-6 TaxID=2957982 RepID=UPI00209EC831|nr:DUF2793 domain-containing protein [Notoacmeibacter sp. MSK16QG-6]MCP1198077.1 DUF2793 domain-containing protein [Notoacmeibacter sp. MSK16QG-6]
MSTTATLALPYLYPQQAQKHVTVNEALRLIDMLVQLAVRNRDVTDPQSLQPEDGECWIVGPQAVGDWAGHDDELAAWQDDGWSFSEPRSGWIAYSVDEQSLLAFDGTAWIDLLSRLRTVTPQLGVNTDPDSYNRLAVKSDAVLLSHDDVTPGSGSIRVSLNRQSQDDAASLILQTGFSGRAEIGLNEADNLQIKVSGNGSEFHPAIVVDRYSGKVAMPATPAISAPFNLLKDGGRFAGAPESTSVTVGAFVAPSYVIPYNGAQIAAGPQFYHNNATFGGTGSPLDSEIEALMSLLRTGTPPRYGVEFYTLRITAGADTSGSISVPNAGLHYLTLASPSAPIPAQLTVNYHIKVLSGSAAIRVDALAETYLDGFAVEDTAPIVSSDGWIQATRLYDRETDSFPGYYASLFGLYTTPGTELLVAAPTITPGHIAMGNGQTVFITPSLETWR